MSHPVTSAVPAPSSAPSAAVASGRAVRRLPWLDRFTLAALVTAVVVVTIPRLRELAIHGNERDARAVLEWLGEEFAEAPGGDALPAPGELIAREPAKARRLSDARALDGGLLLHHGYLFRSAHDGAGDPVLVAWPAQAGRTGERAYAWSARALWEHPNATRAWSGAEHAPLADPRADAGWSRVE